MHPASRLLIFCCLAFQFAKSQRIQYSRHLAKDPQADGMQLVADIDGFHHLLSFSKAGKPEIYLFSPQLRYLSSHTIDIIIHERSRTSILPFKNHYLLYVYSPIPVQHRFFIIHADGSYKDISASVLRNSPHPGNSFRMQNENGKLLLSTANYSDSLKTLTCTIFKYSEDFTPAQRISVFIPFDTDNEHLRQLTIYNNELLGLKEKKSVGGEHILELLSVSLVSKKMISKEFSSGSSKFYSSAFRINQADTSILVSFILPQNDGKNGIQHIIFLSKLSFTLTELAPPALIRPDPKEDLALNLILVDNSSTGWIDFSSHYLYEKSNYQAPVNNYWIEEKNSAYASGVSPYPYSYPLTSLSIPSAGYYYPAGKIKINYLQKELKPVMSKLLKPYKDVTPVPGRHFFQFILNNTPYLVLTQNILRKKNGLALVHINPKNEIALTDTRASTQFEYIPELLKVIDDRHIIVPFINRKEIGLLKINVNSYVEENY